MGNYQIMRKLIAATAFAVAISAAASVGATEFVTNGNFTSLTSGLGQIDLTTQATGWSSPGNGYNFVMTNATAGSNGQYGNVSLWDQANGGANGWDGLSALSGNFVALDGYFQTVALTQQITGLTVGQSYTLSFEYAFGQQFNFDGATIQSLQVNVGPDFSWNSGLTNVGNHAFTGWGLGGGSFVATQASETLSFLAAANIQLPPFALVSNVSLTGGVPEPATWAMMLIGFGGLGVLARRRACRAAHA